MAADKTPMASIRFGEVRSAVVPQEDGDDNTPQIQVHDRQLPTLLDLDEDSLDANYRYRWVQDSPQRIARAKAKGYQIVNPETEEVKNAVGDSPQTDGERYVAGDTVLMRVSRERFEERKSEQVQLSNQRLGQEKKKFKKLARVAGQKVRGGVQVIKQDKED